MIKKSLTKKRKTIIVDSGDGLVDDNVDDGGVMMKMVMLLTIMERWCR